MADAKKGLTALPGVKGRVYKSVRPDFPHKGCGVRGAKLARHQRKGSGTPGRTKTKSCQAKWMHRGACSYNRSYKAKDYATTMKSIDRKAGRVHSEQTHGLGKHTPEIQKQKL
jgi:hypothetical protein